MTVRILLVNPPVYDFSAYDFWLKPYGLLRVAGYMRGKARFSLFDFMDRERETLRLKSDRWGRGEFSSIDVVRPPSLNDIPRRFHRFGLPRETFRDYLSHTGQFDAALVQTTMTYWHLGVTEVIEDIRAHSPRAKIVLGGPYASICADHARSTGADIVIEGANLSPLWETLRIEPDLTAPPLWEAYKTVATGVIKLTDGCPFRCTYCSVPRFQPEFHAHRLEESLRELDELVKLGARNIAFYDDALLFNPQLTLIPFLEEIVRRDYGVNFHTPNALNARFISASLAKLMVKASFKTFYLGFESKAYEWQKKTGGKVYDDEFKQAVDNLLSAGADPREIAAYVIVGHPFGEEQEVEPSMEFVHNCAIRVMLSEFSPIPGTPDGEACRKWIDLDDPLTHNKTAFAITMLGAERINELKDLCRRLNRRVDSAKSPDAV